MKQKVITLVTGIIFYSTFFGLLMYFVEKDLTVKQATFQGISFGVLMSLFEAFVSPKIKSYIEKRNAKKK